MGFPSPATDYIEERISIDKRLIAHPSAIYMMIAGTTYLRAGIMKGAMLIVDSSLTPKDGSLKDGTLTNQTVGFVGGANTYLNNIGSVIDSPTVSGGAVFKSL